MNKNRIRWIYFVIVSLSALLIVSGESLLVRAESSSPADMLQRAWQKAQEVGSYNFLSDINQTFIPRPVTEMIGQQETALNMALDGAVVLPDQSYSEMRIYNGQTSESVVMLRDGAQSFMLQDGELKPVENALNLASQSNDLLGYLSAADQVTLLDPPEGHPELTRYGFMIDGPRYAEYVRQQAETARQILSAPLTLQVPDAAEGDPGPWVFDPKTLGEMLVVERVDTPQGPQVQVVLNGPPPGLDRPSTYVQLEQTYHCPVAGILGVGWGWRDDKYFGHQSLFFKRPHRKPSRVIDSW